MNFQTELDRLLEKRHLLKHPFYLAWTHGQLTQAELGHYAVQYFPHVEAFPRFVSSVHSMCEDTQSRRELFRNLSEEEGASSAQSHPELWLNFARGLGVEREQVIDSSKGEQANHLKALYFELCRSSYAEGLGALTAYEMQVSEIAELKIDGLKKFYGITEASALEFFEIHKTADKFHSEACMKLVNSLNEGEKALALKSAEKAMDGLWDFLTEVYSTCEASKKDLLC
jgi:pyrroloquinoline-quinone synthase